MIFGLRALFVSLAFCCVAYCLISLLVVCLWHSWTRLCRDSTTECAPFLFVMRVSPLVLATLLTLGFALPAFLKLESGLDSEDLGTLAFGVAALVIAAAGIARVLAAERRSLRVVSEWLEGAIQLDTRGVTQVMRIRDGLPPLVLVGVTRPTMLISERAISLLNDDEFSVAMRHELTHVKSRDNLKKMLLHGMPFPGMKSLENTWEQAAELAADNAAVSNRKDAIELAAALVKLSQLAPLQSPAFATGLVRSAELISTRVERLLAWKETEAESSLEHGYLLLPIILLLMYVLTNYNALLQIIHQATESFIG